MKNTCIVITVSLPLLFLHAVGRAGPTIPTLAFIDPPGGVSVDSLYQVRLRATDVWGGTIIRLYYLVDQKSCQDCEAACTDHSSCPPNVPCRYNVRLDPCGPKFVGELNKNVPGTVQLAIDWNLLGVPDGSYRFLAKLMPGEGVDGVERKHTPPIAGETNVGDGLLAIDDVAIDDDAEDADDTARLEGWTITCIDPAGTEWRVNSDLSHPVLNGTEPDTDAYPHAFTGVQYTSTSGEVDFTIHEGSTPFALGDTFTFLTTGITPVSEPVRIFDGRIWADPFAIISAAPLTGPAPLTVTFDGGESFDPDNLPLTFRWDFGDGSQQVSGPVVEHTYVDPLHYTVVLRVTNTNGRFGESYVNIAVDQPNFDADGDGDVDLRDYALFQVAFFGPK